MSTGTWGRRVSCQWQVKELDTTLAVERISGRPYFELRLSNSPIPVYSISHSRYTTRDTTRLCSAALRSTFPPPWPPPQMTVSTLSTFSPFSCLPLVLRFLCDCLPVFALLLPTKRTLQWMLPRNLWCLCLLVTKYTDYCGNKFFRLCYANKLYCLCCFEAKCILSVLR